MNTIIINHPNPTLNLPKKRLYREQRMAIGFEAPTFHKQNVAYTSVNDMMMGAVEEAASRPGVFVVVAWGRINGDPINPIGFLCFTNRQFRFTPINYSNEDFDAKREGLTAYNISHRLTDLQRNDPALLAAKRAWHIIDLTPDEQIGPTAFERVAKVLSVTLFRIPMSQEALYELAV